MLGCPGPITKNISSSSVRVLAFWDVRSASYSTIEWQVMLICTHKLIHFNNFSRFREWIKLNIFEPFWVPAVCVASPIRGQFLVWQNQALLCISSCYKSVLLLPFAFNAERTIIFVLYKYILCIYIHLAYNSAKESKIQYIIVMMMPPWAKYIHSIILYT